MASARVAATNTGQTGCMRLVVVGCSCFEHLTPNMAPRSSYFHLVFILLPLLISGQVDPVDKSQSSPNGEVDPVDKACEEGIDCVHKSECETFESAPSS